MLRRYLSRVWSRASYHRQYQYVDAPVGTDTAMASQCQCYTLEINSKLPKDKQLDGTIKLPVGVPTYRKHLLVISPKDQNQEQPEWKTSWQSKLELNPKWPYSSIGKLKEHLKHSRLGSEVLVNAVAIMSGDIQPLEATEDRVAHIFLLPDNRLYAIREEQIEDFAHYVGGGPSKALLDHRPTFNDYLKGANNAKIEDDAGSLEKSKPGLEQKFDFKTSQKDWVLICGHYQRDERCGLVGQDLVKEIRKKELCLDANVGLISHVGGHKYAGNVILYKNYPASDKARGRHQDCLWFGKVLPPNLSLLFKNLEEGKIPRDLYRGGFSQVVGPDVVYASNDCIGL